MKTSTRRFVFAVFALLFSTVAFAQNVSLKLQDATNGDAVRYATVSLTVPGKTTAYKYVLSDDKGAGTFENVRKGTYVVKAEMLGYKPFQKTITVEAGKDLNLGVVKMEIDSETLDAATVSDVGNPIIIKKDTIEYNASAFKTTENDLLEDLLKKLPGVEIGDDGSITVNGKTIDKITIGGKTFFQNDPTMATKNLPAKIIKKIKVIRKKSEQAEFTGIDDGKEENVLDLGVTENAMNGLVGNITAGLGHDIPEKGVYNDTDHKWTKEGWRFIENAMLANFTTNRQLALITNANNGNNMGFGGRMGGFGSGFAGFGGGMGGSGITTSWMVGANGAWDLLDNKMNLGGNYVYNGAQNELTRDSYSVNYLADGSQIANTSDSFSQSLNNGHRFGIRLEHKFSSNTSILFEPQINFGTTHSVSGSNQLRENIIDGISSKSSEGFTAGASDGKNLSTSGRFLLRQRLGIPRRTLTFNANYSLNTSTSEGLNQSLTSSFLPDGSQKDSLINQRYDQSQRNASLGGTVTYTEPLGNNFYIEGNYSLTWNRSSSVKDTYDSGLTPNPFTGGWNQYSRDGETPDLAYSNHIINRSITQNAGANLMYQDRRLNAQVGIGFMPTNTYNSTTRNGEEKTYENKVVNFAPRAMVRYNYSDNTNFNLRYDGRSSQPSVSQLMPVPDNANPLSVSFGNPWLKPYFRHNANAELRHSNLRSFSSLNLSLSGSMVQNPIINSVWYGTNSAQYSYPVNGPASFNLGLRLNYNTPIARSDYFTFSTNGNVNYSQSGSYVEKNRGSIDMSTYITDGDTGTFDYERFHNDFPDFGSSDKFVTNILQSLNFSEQLRLTFRNDYVEVVASGRTNARKSWYTVVTGASTSMTWDNRASLSFNWTPLGGWTIQSDYNYVWYNGYTTKPTPEHLLNAQVSKTLGSFTIGLRAYDLLNQAKTLSINESGNMYSESRTNQLGRYVILTVAYRFGKFNGRGGGMRIRGGGGGMGMGGGFGGGMGRGF